MARTIGRRNMRPLPYWLFWLVRGRPIILAAQHFVEVRDRRAPVRIWDDFGLKPIGALRTARGPRNTRNKRKPEDRPCRYFYPPGINVVGLLPAKLFFACFASFVVDSWTDGQGSKVEGQAVKPAGLAIEPCRGHFALYLGPKRGHQRLGMDRQIWRRQIGS